MKRKLCIGIESTAHTFGVGIIDSDGNILSDKKDMFRPDPGKGMIPREAAEHHTIVGPNLIQDALSEAGVGIGDIDLISFSQGPGLPPCLKVGGALARYLAISNGIDLIGVNHPLGHIEIGKLTASSSDPVILYLSGGNTQVIAFEEGYYRIFGETLDTPIGNALDVVARELKLKSPGGPEIEHLAENGSYIELPYVVKGMDMSFSGLITHCKRLVKEGISPEDICYSLQETCFSMLAEVAERALAHTGKNELLLVGGVAANKRLKSMLNHMCNERGAEFHAVDIKYSGDCGIMIAWVGMLDYMNGRKTSINESGYIKNWRSDQAEVNWVR